MHFPYPCRQLDRTGRSLVWVLLLKGVSFHTHKDVYDSEACKIVLCPRPDGPGQPQITTERPCFKEASGFFQLKDDVHEWMEAAGSYYQLEYRYVNGVNGWYVGFAKESEAMMFKLAWANI